MAPHVDGVRHVSTPGDVWAVVEVTARAYGRQLLTRPWANVLGWPALLTWAVLAGVALPWGAITGAAIVVAAIVLVAIYVGVMLFAAGVTAAALGLILVVHPSPGRGTAYLLTCPTGKACVLVRGTNTLLWEATALAAAPPHRGLGAEVGHIVLRDADTAGAALQLWCTRSLERLYARQGFVVVQRRFGMRLMRRSAT